MACATSGTGIGTDTGAGTVGRADSGVGAEAMRGADAGGEADSFVAGAGAAAGAVARAATFTLSLGGAGCGATTGAGEGRGAVGALETVIAVTDVVACREGAGAAAGLVNRVDTYPMRGMTPRTVTLCHSGSGEAVDCTSSRVPTGSVATAVLCSVGRFHKVAASESVTIVCPVAGPAMTSTARVATAHRSVLIRCE